MGRSQYGHGHYVDAGVVAQRVLGKSSDLSPTWSTRLSETWLIVNEPADDLTWNEMDPRLKLTTLPELRGLIFAHPSPSEPKGFTILDPSKSDTFASMMLVIPQLNGRDLSNFEIVLRGVEEWVRFASYLHRPLSSVPALQPNSSNLVTIGAEGYSEWRSVPNSGTGAQLTITTTGGWRLYDSSFKTVGNGKGNAAVSLPAGSEPGYITVFGEPGGTITIQMD